MSYQIQAKGTLDLPDVDPKDSKALGSYFQAGEEQFQEFYKALNGQPNSRFFAARMTLLNALSDHKNGPRMVLDTKGANLQSLIGKPVHFTDDFEQHWSKKKRASASEDREIKTFGVTLGGRLGKVAADGSTPLDVFGLLWDEDHPEAVKMVASSLSEMGMSWEIAAHHDSMRQISHPSVEGPILYIGKCQFTGTAILKRGSAAYPSSQLLVAGDSGNDIELDFSRIPVLDDKHIEFEESSASLNNGDPNQRTPSIIIIKSDDAKKETPMGEFCASCKPEFDGRLSRGEIISKDDFERQKLVTDLKASADAAEAKVVLAAEAQKLAEEETVKLKAEKAHLEKVAAVETKAIAEWEAVKKDFGDDSTIRAAYLSAQEKILLGESIESVSEGFKQLLELDKKKATVRKAAGRFSAFDGLETETITDAQKAGSSKIIAEQFHEASLRSLLAGHGLNPHARLSTEGS